MTKEAIVEDCIQPISRAVTRKIERSVRPDEQTIPIVSKADTPDPLPRAALIRLITRNYEDRRVRSLL